jgi:hypothetical protein
MIQNLANKAINYLRKNYTLPNSGILAGGSLANLIWEYTSGNKAIINDIDIFIFEKKIELSDTYVTRTDNGIVKKEGLVIENFTHPYEDMIKLNKDSFYQITSTDQIDYINYIYYDSNKEGILNIINAFDFNCTQIGYDLKTNEILWTQEFEEFIKIKKILCTNLQSPVHSIVRLPKKCEELNLDLPIDEIHLLTLSIISNLSDMNKRYISDKYVNYYKKYEKILSEYVSLTKEPNIEDYFLKNKNVIMNIYSLTPMKVFRSNNAKYFHSYYDLLFYWRNIKNFPNRKNNWKFHKISNYNPEYFDENVDLFDLEILNTY